MSSVPTSLASLPSLKFLYIRDAKLTGDLSYMEYMPSIVERAVNKNPGLTGPLYPFIGGIGSLRSFAASDCSLVSAENLFSGGYKDLSSASMCFLLGRIYFALASDIQQFIADWITAGRTSKRWLRSALATWE